MSNNNFSKNVLIIYADEQNTYYSKPEVQKILENYIIKYNDYAFIIVCTKNSPSYKLNYRSTFQHNFGEILMKEKEKEKEKENNFIRLAKIDATPQKNRTYTKNNTSANVRTRIYYNESKVGFSTTNIKNEFNKTFKESYPTGNGNVNYRKIPNTTNTTFIRNSSNYVSINEQKLQIAKEISRLESNKNGENVNQQTIQKKIEQLEKEMSRLQNTQNKTLQGKANQLQKQTGIFKRATKPKGWSLFGSKKGGSKIFITGLEINRQTIRNQNNKISNGEIYIKLQFQENGENHTLEITNNNSSSDLNVNFHGNKNTPSIQTIILKKKNNRKSESSNVNNRKPLINKSQKNITQNNQHLRNNTVNEYITNMAERIFNYLNKYYETNYNINNRENLNKLFIQFAIDIILSRNDTIRNNKIKMFRDNVQFDVKESDEAFRLLGNIYNRNQQQQQGRVFSFLFKTVQQKGVINHTIYTLIVQNFSVITSINQRSEIKNQIEKLINFNLNNTSGEINKFKEKINSLSEKNNISSVSALKIALDKILNLTEIKEGRNIKYYNFKIFK